MPSPTFVELQQRVQNRDYGAADLPTVRTAINEAYEEVMSAARWPFARQATTITTVAGTATVSLSALAMQDFGRLRSESPTIDTPKFVEIDTNSEDVWAREAVDTTATGVPTHFTLRDFSTIEFYPVPNGAYSYTLYYWRYPTLLVSDADEPVIPPPDRQVLVYGALARMAERDRDYGGSAYYDSMFQRQLAQMRGKYLHARGSGGATRAAMPDHYGGEFDL